MKYPEISFQTVLNAIRHHWKRLLVTILLFTLLGAGMGAMFADRAAAPAGGAATPLEDVSYDEVYYDKDYYSSCKEHLFLRYADAITYVNGVFADISLSEEQKLRLTDLLEQLEEFKKTTLLPISNAWAKENALYIPTDFIADEITYYENLLENTQLNLIKSEAAVDLLRTMDAPDVGSEAITNTYQSLLSAAAQYGNLQVQAMQCEARLEKLGDSTSIAADARWMEQQLKSTTTAFNRLQAKVCQALDEIAAENDLDIQLTYVGDTPQVNIGHTHTLATSQEAFSIMVLFCSLVGACFGVFLAVCREASGAGKKKPKIPQASHEQSEP